MPDVVNQPGAGIATIKRQVFQRRRAGELADRRIRQARVG